MRRLHVSRSAYTALPRAARPSTSFIVSHDQTPGRPRLPRATAAREDRGRPHQAAHQPARPLARLLAGRRRALPRDQATIPTSRTSTRRKGNLVAVVTNGTAVLGLGNIGALAGKPVMEGKGNLFKQFADLDVFDLEVGSENPDDVIRFCQLLEPTVGGINLEDIRAPDCFYIEETLRKTLQDSRLPRRPARHGDHLRRRAAQRARDRRQEASTRCRSCSPAPAPPRSPPPSTTSGSACGARTSSCATAPA